SFQLNYLDLSGNFITTVDDGAFEPLQKLETLIFGERNYINDTVVDAIVTLKSLKTLDLSRADGIFTPPAEIFDVLPHLEVLKLSGCSISALEPGAFAALKNLKEVTTVVQLCKQSNVENIGPNACNGMSVTSLSNDDVIFERTISKPYQGNSHTYFDMCAYQLLFSK
ncbi:Leucine Rich repeat-containing domain protein, partial [Trichostrongylus colubriformis]